jgi:hypothetical protein
MRNAHRENEGKQGLAIAANVTNLTAEARCDPTDGRQGPGLFIIHQKRLRYLTIKKGVTWHKHPQVREAQWRVTHPRPSNQANVQRHSSPLHF